MRLFVLIIISLFSLSLLADVKVGFVSFSSAKKRAEKYIYHDQDKTFYCRCDYVFDDTADFDGDGNIKESMIKPMSCGYTPRNPLTKKGRPNERASRIEWEHIVPAAQFGQHRACWKKNGKDNARTNCAKTDEAFEKAEGDLHNLVPAVGELNADRSNFNFGDIDGERRDYGQCDFEVSFKAELAEPPSNVKGDIARIYLYMIKTHDAQVMPEKLEVFKLWNDIDPVDKWECERDKRILKIQGNSNIFVGQHCSN
ncbi:deoxyribonuclease I [Pseudoalteromonas sp. S201]|uniref:endonuclease n=1 Tax=Pseudoalteromonas sp. S201 TaxID=579519 RepID=UPI00110CDE59|nr:endonuclease [Pseudoalteromonas sp. S201]TMS92349.1 deoxyribonuclease I [Pseudoalteromonas sp. S201]